MISFGFLRFCTFFLCNFLLSTAKPCRGKTVRNKMFQSIQWWTRLWSVECTLASFNLYFSRSLCMNLVYMSLALGVQKKSLYSPCAAFFQQFFSLCCCQSRGKSVDSNAKDNGFICVWYTQREIEKERQREKNWLFTAKARASSYE